MSSGGRRNRVSAVRSTVAARYPIGTHGSSTKAATTTSTTEELRLRLEESRRLAAARRRMRLLRPPRKKFAFGTTLYEENRAVASPEMDSYQNFVCLSEEDREAPSSSSRPNLRKNYHFSRSNDVTREVSLLSIAVGLCVQGASELFLLM